MCNKCWRFGFCLPAAAIRVFESIGENDVAAKSLKDEFYVLKFEGRQRNCEILRRLGRRTNYSLYGCGNLSLVDAF